MKHPRTLVIAAGSAILMAVAVCWALPTPAERVAAPFEPEGVADFRFVAIPEPGALISLIGGAAVLIGIQRFRRRS